MLTDAQLDSKIEKIVDEKIQLADEADDLRNDLHEPTEEEEEKGLGVFPFVIFGVLALAAVATVILKNSPNNAQNGTEEQNAG